MEGRAWLAPCAMPRGLSSAGASVLLQSVVGMVHLQLSRPLAGACADHSGIGQGLPVPQTDTCLPSPKGNLLGEAAACGTEPFFFSGQHLVWLFKALLFLHYTGNAVD